MLNHSKLSSKQFTKTTEEPIDGCLAFLIENNHPDNSLHIGFAEGEENIELKPFENRPFRASDNHVFDGTIFIKMNQNGGRVLVIKETPINKESL
jgi:hypothetical protein